MNDTLLQSENGHLFAQTYRDRILADAMPARTLPVGANSVPRFTPPVGDDRSFDMNALQHGWPTSRLPRTDWRHSDIREVAYVFVHPVFNQFVNLGNLK